MTQISIEQILENMAQMMYRAAYNPDYSSSWLELSKTTRKKYKFMAQAAFDAAHIRELLEENKRMTEVLLAIQANEYCCCSDELAQAVMQALKQPKGE